MKESLPVSVITAFAPLVSVNVSVVPVAAVYFCTAPVIPSLKFITRPATSPLAVFAVSMLKNSLSSLPAA